MEIQSAFNSGVQGFNKAEERVAESALAINSLTTNDDAIDQTSPVGSNIETSLENNTQGNPQQSNQISQASNNVTNLNKELVELKVAEFQSQASTNVIRTADEVLGTLIDVTA